MHATDSINKFNLKFIYFVINLNKRKKNVNCFYIKIAVLYVYKIPGEYICNVRVWTMRDLLSTNLSLELNRLPSEVKQILKKNPWLLQK